MTAYSAKSQTNLNRLCRALPVLIFGASLLLSWITAYSVSMNLLDSDASSELALAQLLSRQNQLLTSDWFYSNELRVTSVNLVFAPLFKIFTSWHMVRFVGIVIMQLMLALSYFYLCRQMRVSRRAFFLSASFLVLPFSVAYGRIVLYHTYYLPFVVIGFLLTGLFLAASRQWRAPGKPLRKAVLTTSLLALSFVAGLNGIRVLMVLMAPLLLSALLHIHQMEVSVGEHPPTPPRSQWKGAGLALAVCGAGSAGYLVNALCLAELYSFSQYDAVTIGFADAERILGMALGYLSQYGFQEGRHFFSLGGFLSLGGLLIAAYFAHRGFRALRAPSIPVEKGAYLVQILFPTAILTMTGVFLFTTENSHYLLYFIPVAVWAIPVMATWMDSVPKAAAPRLLFLLVCILVFGNSLYNCRFFLNPLDNSATYQGLNRMETDTVENLRNVVDYLQEEEYTLGYASFWNTNVITEMTDGSIGMVNVVLSGNPPEIAYYDWLSNKHYREQTFVENQKVFLLLRTQMEWDKFFEMPLSEYASLEYEDEFYTVFSFESPLDPWRALQE